MIEPSEIPNDVEALKTPVQAQAATIASQSQQCEELAAEMEKLRTLLSYTVTRAHPTGISAREILTSVQYCGRMGRTLGI